MALNSLKKNPRILISLIGSIALVVTGGLVLTYGSGVWTENEAFVSSWIAVGVSGVAVGLAWRFWLGQKPEDEHKKASQDYLRHH